MHPSSRRLVIFIFDKKGVNSVLTHEEGKCLSISCFKILETFTPDRVPVIVEGFKPQFTVTDNKSGSDIQSSVSLSLKHELPL